jgi:hypothetical protein
MSRGDDASAVAATSNVSAIAFQFEPGSHRRPQCSALPVRNPFRIPYDSQRFEKKSELRRASTQLPAADWQQAASNGVK